jgi:hypothetical protein
MELMACLKSKRWAESKWSIEDIKVRFKILFGLSDIFGGRVGIT